LRGTIKGSPLLRGTIKGSPLLRGTIKGSPLLRGTIKGSPLLRGTIKQYFTISVCMKYGLVRVGLLYLQDTVLLIAIDSSQSTD
jgi:hypothetical protein